MFWSSRGHLDRLSLEPRGSAELCSVPAAPVEKQEVAAPLLLFLSGRVLSVLKAAGIGLQVVTAVSPRPPIYTFSCQP